MNLQLSRERCFYLMHYVVSVDADCFGTNGFNDCEFGFSAYGLHSVCFSGEVNNNNIEYGSENSPTTLLAKMILVIDR